MLHLFFKLKAFIPIFFTAFFLSNLLVSQTTPFKENLKWGIKDNEKTIIAPLYDTIFNFDDQGAVCLACFKTKTASANKFIKTVTTSFSCNYLDARSRRLSIKAEGNDTCSTFILNKSALKLYNDNSAYFTVSVKNKKHIVDKDFKQLTFNGYNDIMRAPDAGYYIAQVMNEGGVLLTGLTDLQEKNIIPFNYSGIGMNRYDSLIIACSAGLSPNGSDDVFNYKGEKIASYRRHVDMATKNFVIHKVFEPKEAYIIYNIATKEEKSLSADEIRPSMHDEILMRIKNDWYLYDLNTNQKKTFKQS